MTEKRQILILIAVFIIGVGIAAFLYTKQGEMTRQSSGSDQPAAMVTSSKVGGPFTLVNHFGEVVTNETYSDSYNLMFFGFTNCPDICPAGLQKMALVMDALGDNAQDIQPLFVTVDPERDTPEEMRNYVENFHDEMIGLTGTPEQIAQVEEDYKVYAKKMETEEGETHYMVNHSGYMYLMDKDDNLITMFDSEDSADIIAEQIRAQL